MNTNNQDWWTAQVNVVNNVINNSDIQKSYEYYNMFTTRDPDPYKIVNDYRQEVECSEWTDNPLTVSYKIMNWLLQRKKTPQYTYIPEELKCWDISNEQIKTQLQNIEVMNSELQKFPSVTTSNSPQGLNLFRGVSCDFINFETLRPGSQTTIDSFLSTSLFISTATRFTGSTNCIMIIHVHPGTPLPFITDNLLYMVNDNVSSEAEVVLPIGATLTFSQKFNSNGFNIYCFDLTSFRVETRQFWSSYNAILERLWPHIEQLRIIQKQKDDDDDAMNVGGVSMLKKKSSNQLGKKHKYKKGKKSKKMRFKKNKLHKKNTRRK
jgi:hypothetical protein